MNQEKQRTILPKLEIAMWSYLAFLGFVMVAIYTYGLFTTPLRDWGYVDFYSIWMGVTIYGMHGIFGYIKAWDMFLFPFSPVLILMAISFIIVSIFYTPERRSNMKRWALRIFILFVSLFIVQILLAFAVAESISWADSRYYWNTYGTKENVVASFEFIKPTYDNRIIVLNDGVERVLYDYSGNHNLRINYISPKGQYFIDDNQIKNLETLGEVMNINIEQEYSNLIDCIWLSNELYISCQYRYKSEQIDENRRREREIIFV